MVQPSIAISVLRSLARIATLKTAGMPLCCETDSALHYSSFGSKFGLLRGMSLQAQGQSSCRCKGTQVGPYAVCSRALGVPYCTYVLHTSYYHPNRPH
jgi:hypothetical protein